MMTVTIDPSETRRYARPAPRQSRLRLVLLSGLGVLGLAGFTALASSVLGGLAGPQFVRPTLQNAALTQKASEWPDLRDGIPALAPAKPSADQANSNTSTADKPVSAVAAVAVPAPVIAPATPPRAAPPAAMLPAPKPAQAAPPPARLPPIENAAVLPPARPASLVPASRTVALVAPTPAETTRSRATNGTFTALPPERDVQKPKQAATATHAAKPVAAKPNAAKVASAAPVSQSEPEPEQTEVFGIKVPSLAPAGRKLAEGVEALGNAVKSLPDRF